MSTTSISTLMGIVISAVILGCASVGHQQRGKNYPGNDAPYSPSTPYTDNQNSASPNSRSLTIASSAGPGLDSAFERSAFMRGSIYASPNVLLSQIDAQGRMGINRNLTLNAGQIANNQHTWFIEEQRFADTIVGAGINRNNMELIQAGIKAIEWGFAQQQPEGGFACSDAYLSTAYFTAASAHIVWLLTNTGYSRELGPSLNTIQSSLHASALWLTYPSQTQQASAANKQQTSRLFLIGYALGLTGQLMQDGQLVQAGERAIRQGLSQQHSSGYFLENGGFDVSYQAEGLVYLQRYFDHVASIEMRKTLDSPIKRGLNWLNGRISAQGIINSQGSTRSGTQKERDRTGQFRRVSTGAIARALAMFDTLWYENKYEARAKNVLNPKP